MEPGDVVNLSRGGPTGYRGLFAFVKEEPNGALTLRRLERMGGEPVLGACVTIRPDSHRIVRPRERTTRRRTGTANVGAVAQALLNGSKPGRTTTGQTQEQIMTMATKKKTTKKSSTKKVPAAKKSTAAKSKKKKKAPAKKNSSKRKTSNGLTSVQVKILEALARNKKELSYREVSDKSGVSYGGLTAIMSAQGRNGKSHPDSLEAKKLIKKHEAQDDSQGRSPFVWAITAAGRKALESAKANG